MRFLHIFLIEFSLNFFSTYMNLINGIIIKKKITQFKAKLCSI